MKIPNKVNIYARSAQQISVYGNKDQIVLARSCVVLNADTELSPTERMLENSFRMSDKLVIKNLDNSKFTVRLLNFEHIEAATYGEASRVDYRALAQIEGVSEPLLVPFLEIDFARAAFSGEIEPGGYLRGKYQFTTLLDDNRYCKVTKV